MKTVFDKVIERLEEAKKAASLQNASFGFPSDRIDVKSVHFENERNGCKGDSWHPTEYVRQITRLHHETWIISPLNEAIALLKLHADTLRRCEGLLAPLDQIASVLERAKAGLDSNEEPQCD